jgi:hypothetical protein
MPVDWGAGNDDATKGAPEIQPLLASQELSGRIRHRTIAGSRPEARTSGADKPIDGFPRAMGQHQAHAKPVDARPACIRITPLGSPRAGERLAISRAQLLKGGAFPGC